MLYASHSNLETNVQRNYHDQIFCHFDYVRNYPLYDFVLMLETTLLLLISLN